MEKDKKPFVIMNLDKPRKFRMTLNAIIEMQQKIGIDIEEPDEFVQKLLNNPNLFSDLKSAVHYGPDDSV